jgi:hypothetical protein
MASTITLSGDWLHSIGDRLMTAGTGNLGNPYATDGIAVSAAQCGLGVIDSLEVDPVGGYIFSYVKSTGKVKAFAASGTVTGGTVADHTHDMIVIGGGTIAANSTAGLSSADALVKVAVTDKTVVGADSATKGGVKAASVTISNMAATISAAECGAIDLSTTTFNWRAYGK